MSPPQGKPAVTTATNPLGQFSGLSCLFKKIFILFYGGRYAHFTAKDTEGQMALS